MNLLEETTKAIVDSGHTWHDVQFIGSLESGYQCTVKEFFKMANREYDNTYGSQKVASDLVVVFTDMQYMERMEYDGSEWWQYIVPVKQPSEYHKMYSPFVNGTGWEDLEEIHTQVPKEKRVYVFGNSGKYHTIKNIDW